jgi:hypothetical protein
MPFGGLSSILDKARADNTMAALPVALSTMSVIRDSSASPASSHLLADRRTVSRDLLFTSAYTPEQRRKRRVRTLHREQTRSPLGRTFSGTLQWSQTKGWPRQTSVGLSISISEDDIAVSPRQCSTRRLGAAEAAERMVKTEDASKMSVEKEWRATPTRCRAKERECHVRFGSLCTKIGIQMTAGGKTGI